MAVGDEWDGEWAPAGVVSRPGAGRFFYTALGHDVDAYQGPEFLAHLRGGLARATGRRVRTSNVSSVNRLRHQGE
ncbi:ThuA domain-containing protein [Streptomyces sp. LUP30]|uniref:ThuA domain-containing protein n=1 Tax=Streptomyces sp. LUP30 TaxID=1890285 RepID=UPI0035228A72